MEFLPMEFSVNLDVGNTTVNVDKHQSLTVEARKKNKSLILMFCLGHISDNTAVKSMNIFFDHITEHFDIEELLVNVYFNLIILPKTETSLKSLYIK